MLMDSSSEEIQLSKETQNLQYFPCEISTNIKCNQLLLVTLFRKQTNTDQVFSMGKKNKEHKVNGGFYSSNFFIQERNLPDPEALIQELCSKETVLIAINGFIQEKKHHST